MNVPSGWIQEMYHMTSKYQNNKHFVDLYSDSCEQILKDISMRN